MRTVACAAVVLFLAGCGPVSTPPLPALQRIQAERVAIEADDVWRAALSGGDAARLGGVFGARALALAAARVAEMRRRGDRLEEKLLDRRLVHWSGGSGRGQAVLQVQAVQRLLSAASPAAAWTEVLRQWSLAIAWVARAWRVVAAAELPPDRWWPA